MEVLNIEDVKKEISFPIKRNILHTKEGLDSLKDSVVREDTNEVLGVIGRAHFTIPYVKAMDWITNSFKKIDLPVVLKDSKLIGGGKYLHQEYVIEKSLEDPDGNTGRGLKPFIVLSTAYAGGSTKMSFGTFRLVCSNGAIARKIVERIIIKEEMETVSDSIVDSVKYSLERLKSVTDKYKVLAKESFLDYLWALLSEESVSFSAKKEVLNYLVQDHIIDVNEKFSKVDLVTKPTQVVKVLKEDTTAWHFYNILTAIATHNSGSIGARIGLSNKISGVFGI